ncbi:MAG: hypothetical protein ACRBBR_05460 [Cellvibrionaceae bacterium]
MIKLALALLLFVSFSLPSVAKDFSTTDFKVTLPESYRGYVKQIHKPTKKSTLVAFDNQFGQSSSLAIEAGKHWDIDQLIKNESKRIVRQKGSVKERECPNRCQIYYASSSQGSSSEHVLLVKTAELNFIIKLITDDGIEKGKASVFKLAKQIYPAFS